MTHFNMTSPLSPVETPNQLSFWQSVGIAAQLSACHDHDGQESVSSFWQRIAERIQDQSLLILFNQQQCPVAFSSWIQSSESDKNADSLDEERNRKILFTDLVSPFSSPLYFHRFLYRHFNQNGKVLSADLLAKHQEQAPRKIW